MQTLLDQVAQQSYPTSSLYVVGTPIGNRADLSLRAYHVLSLVDIIACEDTRHTKGLLQQWGVHKPLIAAHQHNEKCAAETILGALAAGQRVALVSDAGTPAISDPGAKIVSAVRQAGYRVMPIPGGCAAIAALSASGLVANFFYFVGFLPQQNKAAGQLLGQLQSTVGTLIFYEAPHRLFDTIHLLTQFFPKERTLVFAKELTKCFETIHSCSLYEALDWLKAHPDHQKGEFVLLLEGLVQTTTQETLAIKEAHRILTILLTTCSVKDAAHLAAAITGLKKNKLYEMALAIYNTPT